MTVAAADSCEAANPERLTALLDGLGRHDRDAWRYVLGFMDNRGPDRTATAAVGRWYRHLRPRMEEVRDASSPHLEVNALTEAGLSLTDQVAYAALSGFWSAAPAPSTARLWSDLSRANTWCPHLPLRDTLGWIFYHVSNGGASGGSRGFLGTTMAPWSEASLGVESLERRGWLYAAAGLTPAEASTGLREGSLTEESALAMAALRGAVLPA